MPPPPPSPQDLITTYRHLFKASLRAVQYSKPARFVVRDRLRQAFRDNYDNHQHLDDPRIPTSSSARPTTGDYDLNSIARTLEFLDGAARVKGLEHKIVKNLMHVWWEQAKLGRAQVRNDIRPFRNAAFDEFDATLERLNRSMGLCLR